MKIVSGGKEGCWGDHPHHKSLPFVSVKSLGSLRGVPAWCAPVSCGQLNRGGMGTGFQIGGQGRCRRGICDQLTAKSGRVSCGQVISRRVRCGQVISVEAVRCREGCWGDHPHHKSLPFVSVKSLGSLRGVPAWCAPVSCGQLNRGGMGTGFQIGGQGRCRRGICDQLTAKSGRVSCGQVISRRVRCGQVISVEAVRCRVCFKNRSMKSEEDLRGQQILHVGEPITTEVI
ncbi:hypothetical protein F2Q69_00009504 [Brassica cretica]|uniref:Uncharacterized protein n=1 Tax=Brassica cretica TaxID=69181 RepID=A0A8S9NZ62_BRACR|nr:hypothetical protein F2Q69_00009504 [Brassica cretica]